jgi:serine O-acetyltransferase
MSFIPAIYMALLVDSLTLCFGLAVLFLTYLVLRTLFKIAVATLFFSDVVRATLERDPAASGALGVILTYPGLQAVMSYRLAHWLHKCGFRGFARVVSQRSRHISGIEIHPGAKIGKGFFIDHGMGVVIGETAVIGDNVTLFQGVTLGGTGKEKGKRHPTIENNVVVGAGAKVLGNITIGENVSVGSNAVVLRDVPANSTVVGVPGRIARQEGKKVVINMDHCSLPDPLAEALTKIQHELDKIESELGHPPDKPRNI